MNVSNLYRKLKKVLSDSNIALVNKGLNEVNSLNEIPDEIAGNKINRLPYFIQGSVIELFEEDLINITTITKSFSLNKYNFISVTIPDSVTSIGDEAFYYCESLTSITIPDSVTSIGHKVFQSCTSLENVTIGNSITSIGDYAFQSCTSLENVTIGNSVTSIGRFAFYLCTSLKSVEIPDSVTSIGNGVFEYCRSLTDIYLKPTTPPTLGDTFAIPSTTTVHVPIGSGDAYRNATNWSSYTIVEDIVVE